jgi:hypothetical protein
MGEKAEEVEIIKKQRRLQITEVAEDIMNAEVPPSLNEISNIAKEVKIVGYEDKNQTMIFALTLSVMLKGIARGDVDILRFFLDLQNGIISQQAKRGDQTFMRLISAIKEIQES